MEGGDADGKVTGEIVKHQYSSGKLEKPAHGAHGKHVKLLRFCKHVGEFEIRYFCSPQSS